MGSPYIIFVFIILAACGDGSQGTSFSGVPSTKLSREFDESASGAQPTTLSSTELIPLASDFLRPSATLGGLNLVLENLNFSASQGHLTENVISEAESLGLIGHADALGLTSDSGPLGYGMQWTRVDSVRPLLFAPHDESGVLAALSEMQLSLDGVPVHNARVKAIVENGATTWLTGSKPVWLNHGKRPQTTQFSLNADKARQSAASELNYPEWRLHSAERIYVPESTKARAAYIFTVSAEHVPGERGPYVPLEIAVDADLGRILWQRPLAMHAVGSAQLYVENIRTSSKLVAVPLPDLQAGDKLNHSLFDVFNCQQSARFLETGDGSVCRAVATGTGGSFSFEYADNRYDEAVAYAAISKAMEKFRSLDQEGSLRSEWDQSKWPGSRANFGLQPIGSNGGGEKRLAVFVSTETQANTTNRCGKDTTPDNAQYLWSGPTGRGNPEILIGYGGYNSTSCGTLKELGKDMDVVMHEFGHHVVFRGLSNSKQQSVALHEGFADYFTYAVSGNNLLAENSFPGRASLRQGNIQPGTTFTKFKPRAGGGYLGVLDYLSAPHSIGEFLSGILWELRTTLGRNSAGSYKMDKIVWDSIDLIKSDGGLNDGVVAISESTKRYAERFGEDASALQKIVNNTFVKYEFARSGPSGELLPADALLSTVSSTQTTSKKKRWGCGDLTSLRQRESRNSSHSSGSVLIGLLLGIPFALSGIASVQKRIRVKAIIRIPKSHRKN